MNAFKYKYVWLSNTLNMYEEIHSYVEKDHFLC